MSRADRCKPLLWTLFTGLLLLLIEAGKEVTCLRGSAVVLQAKAKAAEAKEIAAAAVEDSATDGDGNANGTANSSNSSQPLKLKSLLTGIPQKDYIYDPNLPRELNGHNLTNYPFYNAVPEDIDFNCDGLHDGFYASVPHKCQVYHHCLFGTRYDFLCANYTAFDQKTFICHFVSEVDCDNSPKHYKRNEALYKAATNAPPPSTTTTKAPPTTTAPPQPPPPPPPPLPPRRLQGGHRNRYRRPYRRRRPVYEYYYDEDYDEDSDYYDDDVIHTPPPPPPTQRKKLNRAKHHRPSLQGSALREDETDFDSRSQQSSTDMIKPSVRHNSPSVAGVYDRPRIPPKIRRPVPINERDKYDYTQKTSDVAPAPTAETNKDNRNQKPAKSQKDDDDYYDDEYEEEQPKNKKLKSNDYDSGQTGTSVFDSRRPSNRHRLRLQNRKKTDRYEEDDDDYEQEDRPRPRKGQRFDDYNPRSSRPRGNRGKAYLRDDEAVPAERPGYISGGRTSGTMSNRKRPHNTEYTRSSGRKHQESRPLYEDDDDEDDDYYYDEEDEDTDEAKLPRKNHKPLNKHSGRRDDDYAEDVRNVRRQNTKTSNVGNSQLSSERPTEKSKGVENDYLTPLNKPNDRVTDSYNYKQTGNKNSENPKISESNNKKSVSDTQKVGSSDVYENDDEYEDDNGDGKPLSSTKSSNENINERNGNVRQNSFTKSRVGILRNQSVKTDDNVSFNSREELPKYNDQYKSTTVPPIQEQTNSYSRNSNFYRSRTPLTTTEYAKSSISTTPTTSLHRFSSTSNYGDDYQDTDYSQNYRFKGDARNRTSNHSSLTSNYKKNTSTSPAPVDKSEELQKDEKIFKESIYNGQDDSSEKPGRDYSLDSSEISGPSRSVISVGLFRRPLKSTTTNVIETTTSFSDQNPVSPQKPLSAIGYRRLTKVNESDEKFQRKEPGISSSYGGNSRRPGKVTDIDKKQPATAETSNEDDITQKNPHYSGRSGSNQYQKSAKTSENSSLEDRYMIKNSEDEIRSTQQLPSAPGINYKRPSITFKPVTEDYPTEYDDTSKTYTQFSPSAPGSNYRRQFKGTKLHENQSSTDNSKSDFNLTSTTAIPTGLGEGFRKPLEVPVKNEGSTIINLRSHYGFFNPEGTKDNSYDNLSTGPDSTVYPRLPTKNIIEKPDSGSFSRQPPRNIDITAPGPSAPESTNQNTRNSVRPSDYTNAQNPPTGPSLNIADEEYDVTLNDALQPSTLHPTRSLVDYPQTRMKSRGYLSTVSHPSGFANNRGGSPFLLSTSSSQQYISRIQNSRSQETQSGNTESNNQNKDSQASADEEGYEAVVLAAPQFSTGNLQRWISQRQSRPTEWFW